MASSNLSEAQVRKDLSDADATFLAGGGSFPHATTASMFITMGLEIKEGQCRVRRLAKNAGAHLTIRQAGSLTEQQNVLAARIRAWEQLLPVYMLGILQYQADHPIPLTSPNSEDATLWLPSVIPDPHRTQITIRGLAKIESKLCHAQMVDSLNAVRQILKLKMQMIMFKHKNLRSQRDGTRSTTVIDRVHERARLAASKYHAARIAQLSLVPSEGDVREEEDEFVLFSEDRTRRDGTGQTRRTLLWIWMENTGATSEEDEDDILQVEWAKSRVWAMRTKEEVMLLKEEMRRTLEFLNWKANWWLERQTSRPDVNKADLLEGLSAYALSQANIQTALASHFRSLWRAPLEDSDEFIDAGDGPEQNGSEDEDEEEGEEDEELEEDFQDDFQDEY